MSSYSNFTNSEMDGEDKLSELIENTVNLTEEQTITGKKTFDTIVINNEVIHNHTSFSTEDGIIHQLKNNTQGDLYDYGTYATYKDGTIKYKGVINKAGTDKFYVFHNQTNEPVSSLNLSSQNLGTLIVREPVNNNEVATKAYVESHGGGNYLPLSGGNMTGSIDMGGKDITNLNTIKYNDGQGTNNHLTFRDTSKLTFGAWNTSNNNIDPYIHLNDNDFNKLIEIMKDVNLHGNINVLDNKRITGLQSPASNSEPATKEYVDNHTGGNYLPLSGGEMDENSTISKLGDLTFRPNNKVKLTYFDDNGVSNAHYTTEVQPFTIVHRTGKNIAFYLDGEFSEVELDPGTGGSTFMTMEESNTKVKIHNLLDMNNKKIVNVANGTATADAVNKGQLDQGLSNLNNEKLNRAGGTMSGVLNMSTNAIRFGSSIDNVLGSGSHTALRGGDGSKYISINANHVHTNHPLEMEGNKITGLGTPTANGDATNKAYVDSKVGGHLTKYHMVVPTPSPDSGQTYKTVTNNGFYGTTLFSIDTPTFLLDSQYFAWRINMPSINVEDELVEFYIRIKEAGGVVTILQCNGTYNGSVGSGYHTTPALTHGIHQVAAQLPQISIGLDLMCKPLGAINSTAKVYVGSGSEWNKMVSAVDFEMINVTT